VPYDYAGLQLFIEKVAPIVRKEAERMAASGPART
jgi:hypothetical protein